jgi:methionyl-tRNA formyltransferase
MKSKIVITKEINYQELSDQMSKLGAKLILEALDIIKSGKTKFISQNDKKATYAKKIEKVESQINWNQEAKNVVAKINALYPNPGAWFELKGSRIKVIKAIEIKAKGAPGEIVNKDFTVACLNNAVQIKELKKEGKNKTSAVEFLKGNKLEIGSNINSDV